MKTLSALGALFERTLDVLLPPRPRNARTRARTAGDFSIVPRSHELLGRSVITLLSYDEPAVADLVHSLKYDGSRYAASLAAEMLADFVREEIASLRMYSQKPIVLIPLPLHAARRTERGFNQIELVLDALPGEFRGGAARIERRALMRTRVTPPQTRLPRAERLSNVAGAFAVTDADAVRGCHVFVVDDVATTGATLVNAANPLVRAGADVTLIALARA